MQVERVHLDKGSFAFWTDDPFVLDYIGLPPTLLMLMGFVVALCSAIRSWRRDRRATYESVCEEALPRERRYSSLVMLGVCGIVLLAVTILYGYTAAAWVSGIPHPRALFLGVGALSCSSAGLSIYTRSWTIPAKGDEERKGEGSSGTAQQVEMGAWDEKR